MVVQGGTRRWAWRIKPAGQPRPVGPFRLARQVLQQERLA